MTQAPHAPRAWVRPEDREALVAWLAEACPEGRVAQGHGLQSGDQAQAAQVLDTGRLDRLLAFDPGTGLLRVEAGVRLDEVEATFVPRGWGLASLPAHLGGSVGGAIATDAVGMDHHRVGGFGHQVAQLLVATPAHGLVPCGPGEREAFFQATVGGLGLAGVIAEASLRLVPLESSFMAEDLRRAKDLPELLALLQEAQARHQHVRAWLDPYARAGGRGRGVVVAADPLKRADLPDGQAEALPWRPTPSAGLSRWWRQAPAWALEAFHGWRWRQSPEAARQTRHRRQVLAWQEAEGQAWGPWACVHRAVLPWAHAAELGVKLLELLAAERITQVDLGARSASAGLLEGGPAGVSWRMVLAPSDGLAARLRQADELIAQAGGRLLLAGDGRLAADRLAEACPGLPRFLAIAERVDPQGSLASRWARRLHVRGQ